MSVSRERAKSKATTRTTRVSRQRNAKPSAGDSGLIGVARQVRAWADSVLGIAGAAADVSMGAAKVLLAGPERHGALIKAGAVLRRMRETAGLSVKEVGQAINLEDPTLLELVENGKVALPFEIILRLASVLGRNDPIAFVMRFTRSYNPDAWHTLENLGIGRLAVQAGRERELANVYRASDDARQLSDEEFAAVLAFTKQAFDMAVAFRNGESTLRRGAAAKAR